MDKVGAVLVFKDAITQEQAELILKAWSAIESVQIETYDDYREKNNGRPCCGPVFYIP